MLFLTFVVHHAGREIARVPADLEAPILIGRGRGAQITADDPGMSLTHARIFLEGEALRIRDCTSRNGTFVNGERVTEATLRPGDEVEIGLTTVTLVRAPVYDMGLAPVRSSIPTPLPTPLPPPAPPPPPAPRAAPAPPPAPARAEVALADLLAARWEGAETRWLLLRDLCEALRGADRRARALAAARRVLVHALAPGRLLLLAKTAEGWKDPVDPAPEPQPDRLLALEAAERRCALLATDGARSRMAAPVVAAKQVVALLYIDREGGSPFGEADLRLLGVAAGHVAAGIESAETIADLARDNQDLGAKARDLERRLEAAQVEARGLEERAARLEKERDPLLRLAARGLGAAEAQTAAGAGSGAAIDTVVSARRAQQEERR